MIYKENFQMLISLNLEGKKMFKISTKLFPETIFVFSSKGNNEHSLQAFPKISFKLYFYCEEKPCFKKSSFLNHFFCMDFFINALERFLRKGNRKNI